MTDQFFTEGPDPDLDDDPARPGVDDELQDLIGRAEESRPDPDDEAGDQVGDELDVSCDGKLPADHPDADMLDDLDL